MVKSRALSNSVDISVGFGMVRLNAFEQPLKTY